MRPCQLLPALLLAGFVLACADRPTEPTAPVATPSFTIVDGAHGGSAGFYFLPPMVPAPTYTGTFDGAQAPTVHVCELAGAACGATVVTFSSADVKVDAVAEAYKAVWKTKDAGLDPTKMYRIEVALGTTVLGYADVVILANGSQIKTVDKNQFVATINGGTLQIKFRIERAVPPPPPPPCTPGTLGCAWRDGDVITHSQDVWGNPSTGTGQLLFTNFDAVYFAVGGVLQVGGPITMTFTSAEAVQNYIPAIGAPGPLNGNLVDPFSSAAGNFGGEVVALKLNVDFNNAGHTLGAASIAFGTLTLCGLGPALTTLNGKSVVDFLALANTALGGGASAIAIADLNLLALQLNGSFADGVVSQFAQQHLVNGACPPNAGWQNGDVISYSQFYWGETTFPGGALLSAHYDARYASTFGEIEVGIPGLSGHSIILTGLITVLDYMPSTGPAAPLNADLVDPLSSVSGVLGGEVFALRFNIDFSDSGHILGTSGLRVGDLTLCGFTGSRAGLNGMSVRAFSAIANTALGGGSTPYTILDVDQTAFDINNAFNDGIPNVIAQQHLFSGACP